MRSGNLRHRAEVLSLGSNLTSVSHGSRWASIRAKEEADTPAATGLRSPAMVEVRARYSVELQQGRYLRHAGRLLYITGARDPMGTSVELVLSCVELVGAAAAYTSAGGSAQPCRVHLTHGVARVGDLTGKAEYTTQAEVALIEVGRPQAGALLQVGSDTWRVTGLVEDDDDRIVRRLWVKRQ